MRVKLSIAFATVLFTGPAFAQVHFSGRVLDENRAPIAGARIAVEGRGRTILERVTDVRGAFTVDLPEPGSYRLLVEKDGYFPIRNRVLELMESSEDAELTLERLREMLESLDVHAAAPAIDLDKVNARQGVDSNEILNIPYPNSNDFRSALRIMPDINRDTKGRLHINGGAEEQTMYTLNGFNVADPLTGRFESRLSVESVQEVDIESGNLPAEFGKGSAGTLAVRTKSGDDRLRYSATNFIPGVENRKGLIIGDWTPRLGLSGPIKKGRAWFSDSIDTQYIDTVIQDLPRGEDRGKSWRASNLLHTQVNLTPSNILYTGFLFNLATATHTGLGVLDPVETTVDRRSRQYFFYARDQAYLPGRAVVEFGYAANRTFGRDVPQGEEIYQYTPEGRRGNHFVNSVRKASRDQLVVDGFLPAFHLAGTHQIKGGLDLDHVGYWQDVRRTGYENFDATGTLVRSTTFGGTGLLHHGNYEAALYTQDAWRIFPSLLVTLGMRADWDNLLHRWDVSPRTGFAWSPEWMRNTKLFGGYGRIFDASSLGLFTRPLDQYSMTTYFTPDGTIGRGPAIALFQITNPDLFRPYYRNWTAGVERQWFGTIATRVHYVRRRGHNGFAYVNRAQGGVPPDVAEEFPGHQFDAVYNLTNERVDTYDAVTATVRQNFRRLYEWSASYTFSRARSNTVVDVNVDDPVTALDNVGPMPWDAPHRFVAWAYLPTPFRNWAVSVLTDGRTGFPYSVQSINGEVLGGVNSYRFPFFYEMNVHLERKFKFRKYLWAFRFGSNNVTNRRNPDTVNNSPDSPHFLQMFGGVGRSFNFRIRWLGRA